MKVWEEIVLAVAVVSVLLVGVFMTVFGVAGLAYWGTTGYAGGASTSIVYGLLVLVGLGLVYLGLKKSPSR